MQNILKLEKEEEIISKSISLFDLPKIVKEIEERFGAKAKRTKKRK